MSDLDQWRTEVEERLAALEAGRARQPRKLLVSEDGVCGLDPSRDSGSCPYASLYRRNQGCLGQACKWKAAAYYKNRRVARKRSTA